MPKSGSTPRKHAPRWTPVGLLRPGTEFVCQPGGSLAGGIFLNMCGDDAKVVAHEHGGRERREFWSSAALVMPGKVLPPEQLSQLGPAAPSTRRVTSADERRTSVLNRKETKAIVAKVNQRLAAAPTPRRSAQPMVEGDAL